MPKAANDGARSSVLPCHSQPFDVSFAVFGRTCCETQKAQTKYARASIVFITKVMLFLNIFFASLYV